MRSFLAHSKEASPNVYNRPSPELEEQQSSKELEQKICLLRNKEAKFYELGKVLRELRDKKLYAATHKTFKDYCKSFGLGNRYVYLLIAAADVVDNLAQRCPPGSPLPTSERQIRPLLRLPLEQQCMVWQEAIALASGQVPTCRIVEEVVQQKKRTVGEISSCLTSW